MNPLEWLSLKVFGYYESKGKYFINCEVHGVQPAREHGYDTISCEKCLDELRRDSQAF
jgi:hypothetical protein